MLKTKDFTAENEPLSPKSINVVLGNLFRKESDGSPIDFYIRRLLIADDKELMTAFEVLKKNIQECGGYLWNAPHGSHSIELAFPESFKDDSEYECSKYIFNVEYINDCIKSRELLNIEDFRIGDYNVSEIKDANIIMKGLKKWSEVKLSKEQHQGVKLPDFGHPLASSSTLAAERGHLKKKLRTEYSSDEDYAILRYLIRTNSYDKTGGNSVWRDMERELKSHSYQSLQNRFRRHILPNIHRYTNITSAERNLFLRYPNTFNVHDVKESSNPTSSKDRPPPISDTAACSPSTSPQRQETENPPDFRLNSEVREKRPASFRIQIEAIDMLPSEFEQKKAPVNSDRPNMSKTDGQSAKFSNHNPKVHSPSDDQLQSDRRILDFIAQNGKYGDIHGKKLWIDIRNIVFRESTQDWQAIKRRFFENIVNDLESGKHEIENDVLIQFHHHCLSSPAKEFEIPNEKETDSSSIESLHFEEGTSSTPVKQSKQQSSVGSKQSFGQRNYSLEEDKLILDYIIKTGRFNEVRGKSLWVEVENNVLRAFSRSWESAKNRYLRTIARNLPKYNLEKDVVRKLKAGLVAERNLGGSRRECSRASERPSRRVESEEEEQPIKRVEKRATREQVKHPALLPENVLQASRAKRKLYHQPLDPITIAPLLSSTRISENNTQKRVGSQTASSSSGLSPKPGTSKPTPGEPSPKLCRLRDNHHHYTSHDLHVSSISKCSVVLKRLTEAEISKHYVR